MIHPHPHAGGPLLRQARRLFLERGEIPPGLVDERLVRSWQRSQGAGLAPVGRNPDTPRLSDQHLRQALERHQEFVAHAQPVMEYLYAQVQASHSMVILADNRGLLVHALGDPDFLGKAERVALAPGASWHEQHRGTNAIGTALAEGAAVEIHGAEHFLERNGFLTCAAAPILSPEGQLLGALDISGDHRSHHPHTQGLVRTAAQMIENRLLLSRHRRGTLLHLHPRAEGIGTVAEGVVALSEDGWIIGANRAALHLLGLQAADLGATPLSRVLDSRIEDLLDWGRRHQQQALLLNTRKGERLFAQIHAGRPAISTPRPAIHTAPASARTADDALGRLDTGDLRLKAALDKARKVAGKPIPLLLHGESGVGKELLAQAIHHCGPRRKAPFVAVNCAALPENLIEAELFGYSPGAFTGARKEGSPGRLREAHGGTLFLDEIGDMPLALQSRLLRVLQEREVTPLGGGKPVAVDFSLICATHRPLRQEVEAGRFRADLYYRLNGLTLTLPALRERSDFAALVARLLREMAPQQQLALAPAVARAFADYAWPGNLRQLANALRTATALLDDGEEIIDWGHLPDDLAEELRAPAMTSAAAARGAETTADTTAAMPAPDNLRQLSHQAIQRAVALAQGNMSEAARRLGISRNTLYRKLKEVAG
ncbi:sigma-54-dependent Fis family transcriptional regulator [Azospira sp. I13]|uniref:sigma-54-dependent Fis family transcriptional regulator n=1 Tax=Azospira sp. I13 TaxID=1765050 RepID=UPI000D4A92DF|nr:sigma-54-dependent Fis family transcriptional regulator [Azospira sp. I13]GBG01059.1 sigma-54-dependent Fis family transcriptional regulator [Azospira sp. I13]